MWSRLPTSAPQAQPSASQLSAADFWGQVLLRVGVNPHTEGCLEESLALTHSVPGAPLHHKRRMLPDTVTVPSVTLRDGGCSAELSLRVCIYSKPHQHSSLRGGLSHPPLG